MTHKMRTAVAMAGAALIAVPATAGIASGDTPGDGDAVRTVTAGLDGPRQLSPYLDDSVLVAESDSGEVSSVNLRTGDVQALVTGLIGAQGVGYADGLIYIAVGGPPPPEDATDDPAADPAGPSTEPNESATPSTETSESSAPSTEPTEPTGSTPPAQPSGPTEPPGDAVVSALVIATPDGQIVDTVDLEAYEIANNPDGQVQFLEDGTQPDSLSNPFAVLVQPTRVLVADAGANDVLAIDRKTLAITTFFVPPVVGDEVEACVDAPNNGDLLGCDPVPTGLAEGPNGLIYVSTLGAEAPGAGRVFVLDQEGTRVGVIENLDSATGVAVSRKGAVYVSNVLEGAPAGEGPPPADFDPSTVGEVTRIAPDLSRSVAQVTMPTGLLLRHGSLYGSAWSVAGLIGVGQGLGQVVSIGSEAFVPEDTSGEPTTDSATDTATDTATETSTDTAPEPEPTAGG